MRTLLAWCGLIGAAACASTQSSGVETQRASTQVSEAGAVGSVRVDAYDSPTTRAIPVAITRAWAALPTVYQSLGLSITMVDTAQLVVRGQRVRSRQNFAGKPLSELLDCGDTAGIPNALRYDVTMQLATQLRPDSDSTQVVTQVVATAKASGTAGDPVRCAPNGRIATGVADALRAAAAK